MGNKGLIVSKLIRSYLAIIKSCHIGGEVKLDPLPSAR